MSAFAESARKMAQFQKALAPSPWLSKQLQVDKMNPIVESMQKASSFVESMRKNIEFAREMQARARARLAAQRERKNALKPAPSTEIAIPRRRTLLRRIVATRAGPDDDHHAIAPHDLEQLAAPRRARRSVLHLAGRTSAVARAPRGRFHVTAHPAAREGGACVGLTKGAPSASR